MHLIEECRELLGTEFSISLIEDFPIAKNFMDEAFSIVEDFESRYSRFIDGNKLAELNSNLNKWIQVDDEVYDFFELGKRLFDQTDGAFNLCLKTVLEDLGYDTILSFVEKKGSENLGIFELREDNSVKFNKELDFGALGKGYVVDLLVNFFKEKENFCINAGGDLFAQGVDENGKKWRVGFENPLNTKQVIGVVEVDGFALASSSGNRRKWGINNEIHHLIDANSNRPNQEMLAVFTQSKNAFWADAYSTALFVSGFEKAVEILDREELIEGMLMDKAGRFYRSKNFQGEIFFN